MFPLMARPPNPGAEGYPDETNTGIPDGTILTPSGSVDSSSIGQIIEDLDVTGYIVVTHDNVTVRRCRVSGDTILIDGNNCIVEDCHAVTSFPGSNAGIVAHGDNTQVLRCNVEGTENGIVVSDGSTGSVIEDNYVHDLFPPNPELAHIDGIQLFANESHDVTVRHNSVILHEDANACIQMGNNQGVLVEDNKLHWGGYTIHVDDRTFPGSPSTNIQIINNRFGPHVFNYITLEDVDPIITGNVDDLTGELIPGQDP